MNKQPNNNKQGNAPFGNKPNNKPMNPFNNKPNNKPNNRPMNPFNNKPNVRQNNRPNVKPSPPIAILNPPPISVAAALLVVCKRFIFRSAARKESY